MSVLRYVLIFSTIRKVFPGEIILTFINSEPKSIPITADFTVVKKVAMSIDNSKDNYCKGRSINPLKCGFLAFLKGGLMV